MLCDIARLAQLVERFIDVEDVGGSSPSPRTKNTMDLEKEIEALKARNRKVEEEKSWETSLFRKAVVAVLTYIVVVLFFMTASLPHPFLSALVPTAGFMLSTLSLPWFKKLWQKSRTR